MAPYEGSYEDDPFRQARQMSDISGFYRAFGAEAHGPAFERPDHAGCELEFLAYLGARRLVAENADHLDEADLCVEVEEGFLREHAGRWLPTFFRAVEQAAPTRSMRPSAGLVRRPSRRSWFVAASTRSRSDRERGGSPWRQICSSARTAASR